MPIWVVEFFPPSGERYAPADYFRNLTRAETAQIQKRLETLSDLEMALWPSQWIKPIRGLYQLKSGDHRLYFCIDKRKLIVCHACRKVAQKALKTDLDRARVNCNNYKATR